MTNSTNWIPGIVTVAVALLGALAYLLLSRRRMVSGANAAGELDDLEAQYTSKIAALKEHATQRESMEAGAWASVQDKLEHEAAAILSAKRAAEHESLKRAARAASAATPPTGFWATHPRLAGAAAGGLVVGFAAIALSLLKGAPERAGPNATSQPMAQRSPPMVDEAKLDALARRAEADPENPEPLADLVIALLRVRALDDAKPLVVRLSLLDPYNLKGRVARAFYDALDDKAAMPTELIRLASAYPDAYDGFLFGGWLLADRGDSKRAQQVLENYLQLAPPSEQPPMVRQVLEELRSSSNSSGR